MIMKRVFEIRNNNAYEELEKIEKVTEYLRELSRLMVNTDIEKITIEIDAVRDDAK